jgi:hypothetical protein
MSQREALLMEQALPEWARSEMTSLLPGEPGALYWSTGFVGEDLDLRRIDLLAVLQRLVAAVRLSTVREPFGIPRPAEYKVEAQWLPTTEIEELTADYDLIRAAERGESRDHANVHIGLRRDFGPWGKEILLPLTVDDYERDRSAAWQASLEFAKALAQELP